MPYTHCIKVLRHLATPVQHLVQCDVVPAAGLTLLLLSRLLKDWLWAIGAKQHIRAPDDSAQHR